MKSLKMSHKIRKNLLFLSVMGMFAGAVACNNPSSQQREETDPMGEDNMYEEPLPADTTSAVDTTLNDTLDTEF